jgi:thioredoxin 1
VPKQPVIRASMNLCYYVECPVAQSGRIYLLCAEEPFKRLVECIDVKHVCDLSCQLLVTLIPAFSSQNHDHNQVATLEEVEKIIADEEESGKLVVLYFTANNCPPCKMIAPIYEELSESEEFREKVLFVKINVDDSPETAQNFNVDGWPAFFFLKKGKVLSEMVGGNAAREGLYAMISLWSSM